jgi:precorrin-6Y C5,15-methyltransferase (decarboxylating)
VTEISVIGITDMGPASLSPEALDLVGRAELLCGGERHLAFFPEHPAERFVIKANLAALVERLRDETRSVVVLASGDPCWYGIGPYLAERLGRERVQILSNLSSMQIACARLGLAWQDAVHLSAHGRPLDGILPAALVARTAVILTDERNTPAVIARSLLEAGDEDAHADVFEHLGGPKERHVAGRLSDLVTQQFAALNLLVVRHQRPPPVWPLGLPEEAFSHRNGQITKAEVRVVSLAKLRLHERATLWDIGAGCGSVAIEAAALVRQGQVYAVERDPEQLDHLARNRRRFAAGHLTIVRGEAPSALADLPAPDSVFIGGSGGELTAILSVAIERARSGGRIVLNLVSLEHLGQAIEYAQGKDWQAEVTQIGVARSTVTAGLLRLAALNPVFIVVLSRSGE